MPWINDGGDVAFMGHVAGEECRAEGFPPASDSHRFVSAASTSRTAATGNIRSIAHAGDPAPGGGVYRQAISPVLNDRGDIVFLGDLTPPPASGLVTGVYLHSGGVTIAVARPGDPMPGGGRFRDRQQLISGWQIHVNNAGEVVFNAALDTDDNEDDIPDTGLYVWSHGVLRVGGSDRHRDPGRGHDCPPGHERRPVGGPSRFVPNSGAKNNDRGQVVFGATLSDGRGVLLVATPK